jgi:hypothetical protein
MPGNMDTITNYIHRIRDQCVRFDIAEEYPVFFNRLMFYIDQLLTYDDVVDGLVVMEGDYRYVNPLVLDDVLFALMETHTIISCDEDIDDSGLHNMMELWEKALGIKYGEDYSYQ